MSNLTTKGTIEFDRVSKRYRLGTFGSLRGTVSALLSRASDSNGKRPAVWALRDVSFRVAPGESLGLIGPNGAGKTTTLKLLSNITRPTAGRIDVRGRVSSLIELGAGFHPELTGRENIYLNGAILGLKRHEITRKLDAIIAFSELEQFIDTPVKRYSSGMYVRLGFAVAAHVEPDVMLVDEVLAVGDASFRHRCIQRMRELQQSGTTVLFVSHNMHLVRDMCNSALLLMEGQISAQGTPSAVISEYEKTILSGDTSEEPGNNHSEPAFTSSGGLILTSVDVIPLGQSTETDNSLASHLPVKIKIHYKTASPQQIGRIDIRMVRDDGILCSAIDPTVVGNTELRELSGTGVVEVTYEPLQLTTGKYVAIVRVTDPSDCVVMASGQSRPFHVYEKHSVPEPGVYMPLVHWSRHSADS